MDQNSVKETIRQADPAAFLDPDRRGKGYICPVCGNGSGKSGDGLAKIPLSYSYKCFKCGECGDIFFWIGKKFELTAFPEQLRKACEIYGIYPEENVRPVRAAAQRVTGENQLNVREYLEKCAQRASQTDYFSKRGLSPETVKRFRLGYDPDFREGTGKFGWKAVIIPVAQDSFEGRNIDVSPNSKEKSGFKCRKHGRSAIFNGDCFSSERQRPIFVTEGCFDAMSIIECGGQAAALGGAANSGLLLALLDKVTPAVPLLLALDGDEAGRNAADRLAGELSRRDIPFMDCSAELLGSFLDPNDRLMKDRQGLADAVSELSRRGLAEMASPEEKQRDEYLKTGVYYSVADFRKFIEEAANRPLLSTGFQQVDNALGGGLFTGLYVLGAVSSLGKTTFSLQIADTLAKNGTNVLFFSLEQSKFDLMAKSISRETFEECRKNRLNTRYAQSSLSILTGKASSSHDPMERQVLERAFGNYMGYSERLFIYEGVGNISVDEIKERIRAHISFTGNTRPVVFIDYLQILKAAEGDERATDKQITDRNITRLKQLSRDFDIPVFAVSSLNRQNYSEKINMAAFKESGAIEYGSDVLMGLQLKGSGERDFDLNTAKSKDPREVELIILKNRNGSISSRGTQLLYYPVFNRFDSADGE